MRISDWSSDVCSSDLGMTSRGPILITGGAGFIGSNLADRLASDGQHVLVFDALARRGVVRNLEWLMSRHPSRITPIIADIRDATTPHIAVGTASAVVYSAAPVAGATTRAGPRACFNPHRTEERRVG